MFSLRFFSLNTCVSKWTGTVWMDLSRWRYEFVPAIGRPLYAMVKPDSMTF